MLRSRVMATIIIAGSVFGGFAAVGQDEAVPLPPAEMLIEANKAIKEHPNDYRNYVGRAIAYFQLGQDAAAKADLATSKKLHPKDSEPYEAAASFLSHSKNFQASIAFNEIALELQPNDHTILSDQGAYYAISGNYAKARTFIERALKLAPSYIPAYENMTEVLYKTGDYANAIKWASATIVRDPKNASSYYFRGESYKRFGNKQQAASDLAKAKQLGYTEINWRQLGNEQTGSRR